MHLPKFNIIIVCTDYAPQLNICLHYWSKMKYGNYEIFVVTYIKDIATINACERYSKANVVPYDGKKFHNKGYLIDFGISSIKDKGDYIILSDADMVFSPSTLMRTANSFMEKGEKIISSLREDISDRDLPLFCSNYYSGDINWVWDNISTEIISPSPFMGWFLVFPSSYIKKINFVPNHQGYDVVDWKIFGQLVSCGLKKEVIHIDNSPLHIYHGPKGSNWRGINPQFFGSNISQDH